MSITQDLLQSATKNAPGDAWQRIAEHLWQEFSAPLPAAASDAELVKRDRNLTELDNVISGSAWDLWEHFESAVPRSSNAIVEFWNRIQGGKAVLILDGLSLRETPWILAQANDRGYTIHQARPAGSELPPDTTPFAKSLGFGQRSSLENNGAGSAHKLKGATTATCDLPWKECVDFVGAQESFVFWHHWPDERVHKLAGPGLGLHKLAKETHAALTSDDFWQLVERLTTGRRLVITGDHGYAASGMFPDLSADDQVSYMKSVFKSGRSAIAQEGDGCWVPPIDLRLTTAHGTHQYVLGRRKWKSSGGYPTLTHSGLSLLEVFVPFIELSK